VIFADSLPEAEIPFLSLANGVALQGTTLLASSGDHGNQDIQDVSGKPFENGLC
jgi:hypothetical protein